MRNNLNSLTTFAARLAFASAFTLGASAQALLTKAPVRLADLSAKLPPAAAYEKAVFPSIEKQDGAKKFIAENWDKVVNVDVQKK